MVVFDSEQVNAFALPGGKIGVYTGLLKVAENTGLRGRWEVLGSFPTIICDTAHNREGLSLVFKQLQTEKFQRLHLVLGMVNDKDVLSQLSDAD